MIFLKKIDFGCGLKVVVPKHLLVLFCFFFPLQLHLIWHECGIPSRLEMKEVVPALSANSSQFINNTRQQQHKTNISHQQLRQFMTCLIGKLIEAYTQPERLYYHLLRCVCVLLSRSGSVWMPGAIFTKYLLFIRYWIYITRTCISVIVINRLIASQNA